MFGKLRTKKATPTLEMDVAKIKEKLQEALSKIRNEKIMKRIVIEQQTKTGLIEPIMEGLGYEVHNPSKVVPEKDLLKFIDGKKHTFRVDYALYNDEDEPVALVEAKKKNRPLDSFFSQISGYFSMCHSARTIILTDGIRYLFYAIEPAQAAITAGRHMLSNTPYYTIDLSSVKDDCELEVIAKNLYELKANGFSPDKYIHNQVVAAAKEKITEDSKFLSEEQTNKLREVFGLSADVKHEDIHSIFSAAVASNSVHSESET